MENVKEIQELIEKKFDSLAEEFEKKKTDLSKVADLEKEIGEIKNYQKALEQQMLVEKISDGKSEDSDMKEYKKALDSYIRKGKVIDETLAKKAVEKIFDGKGSDVKSDERSGYILNTKTMSVDVDPQGGYFVRPELKPGMVERIFETTPMRQLADVMSISSSEVEILLDDDEFTSGGWTGEQGSRSVTNNGNVGKVIIHAHEQYAQPRVTQQLLDDSAIDIEQFIRRKTDDILSRTENTAFVSGNGSLKPRGFTDYSAWSVAGTYEREKLEHINSGTNGSITADGLIATQDALLSDHQNGAVWMMNRTAFTAIKQLDDGIGRYLLNTEGFREGFAPRLLGKPVVFSSDMTASASFTTGTLAVAYGDFREGYQIIDRLGINVLRDPYTAKPYILFYTTKRVGGAVKNFQAIKINKLSA